MIIGSLSGRSARRGYGTDHLSLWSYHNMYSYNQHLASKIGKHIKAKLDTIGSRTRPAKLITLERKKGILSNLTDFLIKVLITNVQIFKIFGQGIQKLFTSKES